jgi:hypothetical protein
MSHAPIRTVRPYGLIALLLFITLVLWVFGVI